jgi:tRNA/tmRNA/rRNA uracil-C5-methylase (TrmA/RlmC/RlmD family)
VRFARDFVGPVLGREPVVVDPFCGVGTVLAVANTLGLGAIGVERNRKRAEEARALVVRAEEL